MGWDVSLVVVQVIVTNLSSIGSLMIISQVTRSKFNKNIPQQRLILCISLCDLVASVNWMFTPLLMYGEGGVYEKYGTQATCSLQGFVTTLFVAAGVLYQASLQLQYLLGIKYGWTQRRLKNIYDYLHIVPVGFSLPSAITNLVLKNYNPAGWNCWIAPYPSNCTSSYELSDGEVTDCARGDNARIYQLASLYVPVWLVTGFCCYVMCRIYNHVYKCENRSRRYQISVDAQMKMTKEVKCQALLYFVAYLATWLLPSVVRIMQFAGYGDYVHSILKVGAGGSVASMGFWNAIIYFRPRYKQCDENMNALQKVASLMRATLFFWVPHSVHRRDYVEGVADAVAFVVVGDGKAVELGDSEPIDITTMTFVTSQRSTWAASSSFVDRLSFAGSMRRSSYS